MASDARYLSKAGGKLPCRTSTLPFFSEGLLAELRGGHEQKVLQRRAQSA